MVCFRVGHGVDHVATWWGCRGHSSASTCAPGHISYTRYHRHTSWKTSREALSGVPTNSGLTVAASLHSPFFKSLPAMGDSIPSRPSARSAGRAVGGAPVPCGPSWAALARAHRSSPCHTVAAPTPLSSAAYICIPPKQWRWVLQVCPFPSPARQQSPSNPGFLDALAGASPLYFPPPTTHTKKNKKKRQKKDTFRLARPASSSPGADPNSSLTSIALLHRQCLPGRVHARGLGPRRLLWALQSPIAQLLLCQPRSGGSARWCPPMRYTWGVLWLVII